LQLTKRVIKMTRFFLYLINLIIQGGKWIMRKLLKAPQPGMIEDRRYVMFGLADKVYFTQEEYDTLKEKYPQFDVFWATWNQYTDLLKDSDRISQLATEKDNLQNEEASLKDELTELSAKLNKIQMALQELENATTYKDKVFADMVAEKKKKLLTRSDEIDARLNQIASRIEEIDSKISDYQTTVQNLRSKLEQMIADMGGKLPF